MSVRHEFAPAVASIRDQVLSSHSVVVMGSGHNSCAIPGAPADADVVAVPPGILRIDAGEMTVECLAGTSVAQLQNELAAHGQRVACDATGTVGGNLATSHNSVHRLGRGALRDAVLRLDVVGPDAVAYRCGGATVKNVSGFDLCRMHVGAHGTLGVLVTVLLRTFPLPRSSRWLHTSHVTADDMVATQWGVTSALTDGNQAFVHCEGHERDLDELTARWRAEQVEAPPALGPHRWSMSPTELTAHVGAGRAVSAPRFGELGVGVVHAHEERAIREVSPSIRRLNERVRDLFDPDRRMNAHIDLLRLPR